MMESTRLVELLKLTLEARKLRDYQMLHIYLNEAEEILKESQLLTSNKEAVAVKFN